MDFFQFAERMEQKAKNVDISFNQALVRYAIDIVTEVARATPSLSGRAASNWDVAVGNRPVGYRDNPYHNSGAEESIANAIQSLNGYIGGVIYIANNVPYIAELNAGSSHKAPAMFVQQGVATASYRFKSYKLNL